MAIHFSPRYTALLLLSHLLAAVSVYVTVIPLPFRVMALLLLLLSLLYHLGRDVLLLLPDSWRELSVKQGEVSVIRRDSTVLLCKVADGTVVSPFFILLRIRLDGQRWTVSRILFPDALERDVFRDLCVRLRLG